MSIFDEDQQKKPSGDKPDSVEKLAEEAISLRNSLFGQDTTEHIGADENGNRQEPVVGNPQSFEDDEYEIGERSNDQDKLVDQSPESEYEYEDTNELPPLPEQGEVDETELTFETDEEAGYEAEPEPEPEPEPETQIQASLDVEPPQLQMQQTFNATREPRQPIETDTDNDSFGREAFDPNQPIQDEKPARDNFAAESHFSADGIFNPGMRALLNWGILVILIIVAVWNLTWQSETDIKLTALLANLDQLEEQMGRVADGGDSSDQLANLNARIDALEKKLELAAEQTELSARLDALENNVQIAASQAEKAAKKQAAAKPPAATNPWFINIAVLSDKKNAGNLRDKVKSLGVDGRMESYPSQGRTLYRVRAYGYPSKSAATGDVRRLQRALGLSGFWVGEK